MYMCIYMIYRILGRPASVRKRVASQSAGPGCAPRPTIRLGAGNRQSRWRAARARRGRRGCLRRRWDTCTCTRRRSRRPTCEAEGQKQSLYQNSSNGNTYSTYWIGGRHEKSFRRRRWGTCTCTRTRSRRPTRAADLTGDRHGNRYSTYWTEGTHEKGTFPFTTQDPGGKVDTPLVQLAAMETK